MITLTQERWIVVIVRAFEGYIAPTDKMVRPDMKKPQPKAFQLPECLQLALYKIKLFQNWISGTSYAGCDASTGCKA
jgi:hypothetical protein